ncbi:MAG TPA: O-antigen ligase family protein, partial [Armatimonadota bacterium]|nr:O-antigen ligase family protein [Armatimonadota bacterium]
MVNRNSGSIAQWASSGLLIALALVYANVTPYLNAVHGAESAFFAGMLLCIILSVDRSNGIRRNLANLLPYFAFVLVFFLWGQAVGFDPANPSAHAATAIRSQMIILGGLIVALCSRQRLARFTELVQAASILNCAICLWELGHPHYVYVFAHLVTGSVSHDIIDVRPGGLWPNANEAGFAFLIAILLSFWSRKSWMWAGRAAGVTGIFITTSRTAAYLLVLCAIAYMIYSALHAQDSESARKEFRRWTAAVIIGLVLLLTLASGSIHRALEGVGGEWHGGKFDRVGRLLDFEQKDAAARLPVTRRYLKRAIEAPWFGYGLSTFTEYRGVFDDEGAHDIYLTVWGETGPFMLLAYLLVLAN